MSFFFAPERTNPSQALSKSRSVMNALKRATTIANRFPVALNEPSAERTTGAGGGSMVSLIFFFVTTCL
jgi:hypothetical protein